MRLWAFPKRTSTPRRRPVATAAPEDARRLESDAEDAGRAGRVPIRRRRRRRGGGDVERHRGDDTAVRADSDRRARFPNEVQKRFFRATRRRVAQVRRSLGHNMGPPLKSPSVFHAASRRPPALLRAREHTFTLASSQTWVSPTSGPPRPSAPARGSAAGARPPAFRPRPRRGRRRRGFLPSRSRLPRRVPSAPARRRWGSRDPRASLAGDVATASTRRRRRARRRGRPARVSRRHDYF